MLRREKVAGRKDLKCWHERTEILDRVSGRGLIKKVFE